jgi:PAS domain S-box-containing protein
MTPHALQDALFDAYPDAVLLVDDSGRIVRANRAASTLLGYDNSELLGLAIEALVPEAARAGHVSDRQAFQRAPRSRPMGTQMDLAARRRDGSQVLVEIALSPLIADGQPYVLAAVRGIGDYPRVKQALRRARHAECIAQMGRMAVDSRDPEAVLRELPQAAAAALDAHAGALYVLDADGRRVRTFGDSAAPAPDAPSIAHARPERGASAWPGFASQITQPVADRGRAVGLLEVHARETREAHAFDADDTRFIESLASLVATVLQRAASEDALQHAQRLEAVGQLTGGIAHDFNNLLTIVHGNLQVLEDWPSVAADDGARELLTAAQRATRRGAELTAKLLAFSRRQRLQPLPVSLQRFLPPLADLLRRTLDARIGIELSVASDTPECLADRGQLEAALVNIAINARDAMPDGGTLAFRAVRCDQPPAEADADAWRDGGGVALAVSDSGVGMSEAVLARAFEPFFTTKEAGRGTGLGLATVHGFAHQSGGAVALQSAPGAGTTVTLYLPSARGSAQTADVLASSHDASLPHDLSVLLVEDEPEVLRVVQAFLSGWGCRVRACSHGQAALDALAEGDRFDLLLSDVALGPGLRGTELTLRARERWPALRVLLMSGYAGEADAPADVPLLRKPFTREQLAQAIAGALA